jgi:hypothetical protein
VDGSQRLISASLEVPETLERVFKMERGCVDLSAVALAKAEDQPQQVKDSESLEKFKIAAAGRGRHSRAPAFFKHALSPAYFKPSIAERPPDRPIAVGRFKAGHSPALRVSAIPAFQPVRRFRPAFKKLQVGSAFAQFSLALTQSETKIHSACPNHH